MRRLALTLSIFAACLVWAGAASAGSQELTLTMSDGTNLSCTYVVPDGAGATRLPAIMLFHGLGGTRQAMAPFGTAFEAAGYASLACDARGHGTSGGLFGLDGPRDVQDTRELYDWLAARPELDGSIGALGVSLGGGAVWNAAVAGVPFKAIVPMDTWTDLTSSLAPQGLSKSGLVQLLSQSVPDARWDPALLAARPALLTSTDLSGVHALADPRSSRSKLPQLRTPTFMVQGRHDFLFDIDQALVAYRTLAGPKRLYLGDFGHAPDTFTGAPETAYLTGEAKLWFDRFLKGVPNGIETLPSLELAPDPWTSKTASYRGVPPTRRISVSLPGSSSIEAGGKVVRSVRLGPALETFGVTTVTAPVSTLSSWDHLVAVLSSGSTVISEGGVTTRALGRKPTTVTIRLMDESVPVRRGARLTLTLGGTSLAQSQSNPLYLGDVSPGSTLTVGRVKLSLSVLKRPVSR